MMTAAEAFQIAGQYYQTGQLAPAEHMYRYVVEQEPNHGGALFALGTLALNDGRWEQAIAWMRRATQARPDRADYWQDLGVAYVQAGALSEAVACCEQALQLQPDYALAANDLGLLCMKKGEIERAVESYRRALRAQPAYADAHANLATALLEQGSIEQAVPHYREALRIQPRHEHAYYHLSQLVAAGYYHFDASDLEQLRVMVKSERLSLLSRSMAAFALGNALDAAAAYDEAFAFFQEANALRRSHEQASKRTFDAARYRALVDEVIATFDRAYFEKTRTWGQESELPLFILGMPRSGTSLVEQILSSHPVVYGGGELDDIPRLLGRLSPGAADDAGPRPMAFACRDAAQEVAAAYLQRLRQLAPARTTTRVTNKKLSNTLYLGQIAILFPRARLVACRRDPRDVCLSCYFQNFQSVDFSWSMEDIVFYHEQYERLMAHWRRVLPLPIHEVCYEDLVANQERVTRDLLSQCGLDWDEHCLTFYKTCRAVQTASRIQVRKPLSTKSVGRWKHYQSHLAAFTNVQRASHL